MTTLRHIPPLRYTPSSKRRCAWRRTVEKRSIDCFGASHLPASVAARRHRQGASCLFPITSSLTLTCDLSKLHVVNLDVERALGSPIPASDPEAHPERLCPEDPLEGEPFCGGRFFCFEVRRPDEGNGLDGLGCLPRRVIAYCDEGIGILHFFFLNEKPAGKGVFSLRRDLDPCHNSDVEAGPVRTRSQGEFGLPAWGF